MTAIRRATLLTVFLAGAGCDTDPPGASANPERFSTNAPNVVWIVLDAARAENFSGYGYERLTSPNIDRLATRGIAFERNFAQGIYTDISVASYMTGRYIPVAVMGSPNAQRPRIVPDGEQLFPRILRENGYHTVGVSAHWGMMGGPMSGQRLVEAFDRFTTVRPSSAGAQSWCTPGYAQADEVYEKTRQELERGITEPFFLYVHLLDTHFPHCLPQESVRWGTKGYESESIANGEPIQKDGSVFGPRDQQELRNLYDDSVRYADEYVGQIIAAVEAAGHGDNTIFILGSDHGDLLGEDGTTWGHEDPYATTEELLRVPLVMAGPGIPQDTKVQQLTENADIVPTLVDLLKLQTDAEFDGTSLRPYLEGQPVAPLHRFTYTRTHLLEDLMFHIIRGRTHKLLYRPSNGERTYYSLPDRSSRQRKPVEVGNEVAAELDSLLSDHIQPKAHAYYDLEPLYIQVSITKANREAFTVLEPAHVVPADQPIPPENQRTDGKWSLTPEGLWAASWAEDPPPLTLRLPVPNNTYSVAVLWRTYADAAGQPASSIRGKRAGAAKFELLEVFPFHGVESTVYQGLGVWDIVDGEARFTFETGRPQAWAKLDSLYLVPIGASAASREEVEIQQEQLKALGYLQ